MPKGESKGDSELPDMWIFSVPPNPVQSLKFRVQRSFKNIRLHIELPIPLTPFAYKNVLSDFINGQGG